MEGLFSQHHALVELEAQLKDLPDDESKNRLWRQKLTDAYSTIDELTRTPTPPSPSKLVDVLAGRPNAEVLAVVEERNQTFEDVQKISQDVEKSCKQLLAAHSTSQSKDDFKDLATECKNLRDSHDLLITLSNRVDEARDKHHHGLLAEFSRRLDRHKNAATLDFVGNEVATGSRQSQIDKENVPLTDQNERLKAIVADLQQQLDEANSQQQEPEQHLNAFHSVTKDALNKLKRSIALIEHLLKILEDQSKSLAAGGDVESAASLAARTHVLAEARKALDELKSGNAQSEAAIASDSDKDAQITKLKEDKERLQVIIHQKDAHLESFNELLEGYMNSARERGGTSDPDANPESQASDRIQDLELQVKKLAESKSKHKNKKRMLRQQVNDLTSRNADELSRPPQGNAPAGLDAEDHTAYRREQPAVFANQLQTNLKRVVADYNTPAFRNYFRIVLRNAQLINGDPQQQLRQRGIPHGNDDGHNGYGGGGGDDDDDDDDDDNDGNGDDDGGGDTGVRAVASTRKRKRRPAPLKPAKRTRYNRRSGSGRPDPASVARQEWTQEGWDIGQFPGKNHSPKKLKIEGLARTLRPGIRLARATKAADEAEQKARDLRTRTEKAERIASDAATKSAANPTAATQARAAKTQQAAARLRARVPALEEAATKARDKVDDLDDEVEEPHKSPIVKRKPRARKRSSSPRTPSDKGIKEESSSNGGTPDEASSLEIIVNPGTLDDPFVVGSNSTIADGDGYSLPTPRQRQKRKRKAVQADPEDASVAKKAKTSKVGSKRRKTPAPAKDSELAASVVERVDLEDIEPEDTSELNEEQNSKEAGSKETATTEAAYKEAAPTEGASKEAGFKEKDSEEGDSNDQATGEDHIEEERPAGPEEQAPAEKPTGEVEVDDANADKPPNQNRKKTPSLSPLPDYEEYEDAQPYNAAATQLPAAGAVGNAQSQKSTPSQNNKKDTPLSDLPDYEEYEDALPEDPSGKKASTLPPTQIQAASSAAATKAGNEVPEGPSPETGNKMDVDELIQSQVGPQVKEMNWWRKPGALVPEESALHPNDHLAQRANDSVPDSGAAQTFQVGAPRSGPQRSNAPLGSSGISHAKDHGPSASGKQGEGDGGEGDEEREKQ